MAIREDALRNFSFYYPDLAEEVVDFRIFYYTKTLVKLSNGEVYIYDEELTTIKRMPDDPDDLTEFECRDIFSCALSHIMRVRGVTQFVLSRATGISQQAISSYIRGTRTPTFYVVDKIAKALDCSTDDFRYTGF